MNSDTLILVVLIAAMGGFGSYCFACAIDVWRKRNGRAARSPVNKTQRILRIASLSAMLGGLACMAVVAVNLLVPSPEGLLHGKDLLSVYPPEDLQVEWTTQNKSIEPGDILARFRSPTVEAKIAMLRSTIESRRSAEAALRKKPLEPDPQITRELVDLGNERRHLEYRLTQLQLEHGVIERDLRRQQLTHRNTLHRLGLDLTRLEREWAQAQSDLQFTRKQATRSDNLVTQQIQTDSDHEAAARNLAVDEEEVRKVKECIANTRAQETSLKADLASLVETMESQSTRFGNQIAAVTTRLEEVGSQQQVLEERLDEDLTRAADLRECELRQIDAEIRQAEQEMAGLEATLEQSSRIAGHVVYRATSPRAVRRDSPLLVIGPAESLRLRMRVPRWQRNALSEKPEVKLELVSQMDGDRNADRHFVERWFRGKLVDWQPLPDDPDHGLAELSCEPPAEAVRYLASGKDIGVRIRWWPSPLGSPLFLTGMALGVLGVLTRWAVAIRQPPMTPPPSPPSLRTPEQAPHSDIAAEYGAEGAMLHMLGVQFHEAITRDEIDPDLFAAVEWALDRHRARAVRLIGLGMEGNGLADSLAKLVEHADDSNGDAANGSMSPAELDRLLRIVRKIAPEALPDGAARPAKRHMRRPRTESHFHTPHAPR